MKIAKAVLRCLVMTMTVAFMLCGCQEKPAEPEKPAPIYEDTDWTFEEKLPCGWFFYIQNGDESYPTDDFSGANAMFAYYNIS